MGKEFHRNASRLITVLFLIQLPLATTCLHNPSALQYWPTETLLVGTAAELHSLQSKIAKGQSNTALEKVATVN